MVRRAVQRALQGLGELSPPIVTHLHFGATDPDNLTIHLAYRDRAAWLEAQARGDHDRVRREVLASLGREGYPPGGAVDFVSVEEVDAAGGPWKYFR